jgi:ABC-2 type transport system permease protein
MRVVFTIAFLNLKGLFVSPIAWLVLVVFTVPPGIWFTELLEGFYRNQFLGFTSNESLTAIILANPIVGVFNQLASYMVVYMPLLTMGLISRELSSGSIKLLRSSPIRESQVVMGKFVAMMGYGLAIIAILTLFVAAAFVSFPSADVTLAMSGLLGLYLLICAYSAIGLFMSCLTTYEMVAALSTFVVLAALQFVGHVWQRFAFVRELTYLVSITGRSRDFISGLISSKNLAYFAIVTALFLVFSVAKLRSDRDSVFRMTHVTRYVVPVIVALALGYVSSQPRLGVYYDMSATKTNTLAPSSQAVLARMPGPLEITTYVNALARYSDRWYPEFRNADLQNFEPYMRFKPDLQLRYVYYYDSVRNPDLYAQNPGLNDRQLAQKIAFANGVDFELFLSPAAIEKSIDLKPEQNEMVRQVEYAGSKVFLRPLYDDYLALASESEVATALKRLVRPSPKVAFLTGHGERNTGGMADGDYGLIAQQRNFRYALANQGFTVVTLDLHGQPILDDILMLVVADPKATLGEDAAQIAAYIKRGGNALFAGQAGGQSMLNPLVGLVGVRLMPGTLVQENSELGPDFVWGELVQDAVRHQGKAGGLFDPSSRVPISEWIAGNVFKIRRVIMPRAVGLEPLGTGPFHVHPVLLADSSTMWRHGDGLASASPERVAKPPMLAVGLTRELAGREQRIMIVGDADFMSNREFRRDDRKSRSESANLSLTLEMFKWLSHGEFPVATDRPEPNDITVRIDSDAIFDMRLIFYAIAPALIMMTGAALLISRRRR